MHADLMQCKVICIVKYHDLSLTNYYLLLVDIQINAKYILLICVAVALI